jgi:PII-like signaling protein
MLQIGPALRVVVHLNADVSSSHEFLHNAIVAFLYENGVAGATVFRPDAGFGFHHRLHTKGAPGSDGQHLPIRLEFIDQAEVIDRLMPQLLLLVSDGVVEVQPTTILKVAHSTNGEER